MKEYWSAPELWPGSTVVIIAGGPSLTEAQVAHCKDAKDEHGERVRAIAVNTSYRIAPWADVLYFCDCKWYRWHAEKLKAWPGMIVRLQGGEHDFGDPRIKVLRNLDQHTGLSERRDGLHTGRNSGYQAINLAVHFGAKRIVLLGFDMQAQLVGRENRTHWFGSHPQKTNPSVYDAMLPAFDSLVKPLAERGIEIVNCTGAGRLRVFPRKALEDVLPADVKAAA